MNSTCKNGHLKDAARCAQCSKDRRARYLERHPTANRDSRARYQARNTEAHRALARKNARKASGATDPHGETKSGPCEICGLSVATLHWDHDHSTGLFRGWLCLKCNAGLGLFCDSPEKLAAAARYLRR